jgi:hypothetical protein
MKHIYLCGPVSGRTREEFTAHFIRIEQEIRNRANVGTVQVCTSNPVRFCPPEFDWHQAMRTCIGELVRCGGIALLQGWQRSKGATLELKLAQDLHIPVVYVEPPTDYLGLSNLFTAVPEALRYYNARLSRFQQEGIFESLAENRAIVELSNRYLDPYGFEYIDNTQEE